MRYLFIWELGGGLGHLSNLLPLAATLRNRGHDVFVAVKDVVSGARVARNFAFSLLPIPERRFDLPFMPASYAEVVYSTAFATETTLEAIVRSWHALFALIRPDILICDHAPCSLFAARLMGIPRVNLGTGFFIPPQISPLPIFRDWDPVPQTRPAQIEARVLELANKVSATFNVEPFDSLAAVFACDQNVLVTWPMLDHYPGRQNAHYFGPMVIADSGLRPVWPENTLPKIFAYLKADTSGIEVILKTLSRARANTCLFLAGANEAHLRFASDRLTIYSEPLNVSDAVETADLVLNNAGHALLSVAMVQRRPVLMLPTTAEQFILARKLERDGWGVKYVHGDVKRPFEQCLASTLAKLLSGWVLPSLPNEQIYSVDMKVRCDAICDVITNVPLVSEC
jgi:UDP:flavonoid glycosyltransferase YjiC (YdhE family)